MLVLTRKINEQILIGDDIKVTLIRCRGNTVRIGIEAPREVRIVRGELEPLAQTRELADDAEDILSDREQVFAHPVKGVPRSEKFPETASRVRGFGPAAAGNRLTQSSPHVFVGSVHRSGDEPQLSRAPLAGFIATN